MPNTRLPAGSTSASGRRPPPSKARWSAGHPTIGVNVDRATYDVLDARRRAEGKTWAALLLGDLTDRDAERASTRTEGAAAERKAADRELAILRREHAATLAAAEEHAEARERAASEWTRAAVAEAEARGRAQADPALIAEVERARQEAESWQAGSVTLLRYFEERGTMLQEWADEPSQAAALSSWLNAQEAAIRATLVRQADQLPLPRQVAAEIEAARADERTLVLEAAAGRSVELQRTHATERATLQAERDAARAALATATARLHDLETVVAGLNSEAIAERARRDPSDWLLGLEAALARVAAQPRLTALAAAQEPDR